MSINTLLNNSKVLDEIIENLQLTINASNSNTVAISLIPNNPFTNSSPLNQSISFNNETNFETGYILISGLILATGVAYANTLTITIVLNGNTISTYTIDAAYLGSNPYNLSIYCATSFLPNALNPMSINFSTSGGTTPNSYNINEFCFQAVTIKDSN
jgi:hypothetical protein